MSSLGKRNLFLKKLAMKGKRNKSAMRQRNCRWCPLRASVTDICRALSQGTQHLRGLCGRHLGIVNSFESEGPRLPSSRSPAPCVAFPATCLGRVCPASPLHSSDLSYFSCCLPSHLRCPHLTWWVQTQPSRRPGSR